MTTKVYEIVTSRILAEMEKGHIPWVKPWKSTGIHACNYQGRVYSGMNFFTLNMVSYEHPIFLTFKQVTKMGGKVKKGSTSLPVFFWAWVINENDKGEKKKFPIFRYYNVFNITQTEDVALPAWYLKRTTVERTIDVNAECDRVIADMPAKPVVEFVGDSACYLPSKDTVHMPKRDTFVSTEHFYATMFHELGHSTGHSSRLNRKEVMTRNMFDNTSYDTEELVAELTSAFICAQLGIDNTATITNSAAYLKGYMKALKDDSKLFAMAATRAQKAANFIMDVKEEPVDAE